MGLFDKVFGKAKPGLFLRPEALGALGAGEEQLERRVAGATWPPSGYSGAAEDGALALELEKLLAHACESSGTDSSYFGFVLAPGLMFVGEEESLERKIDSTLADASALLGESFDGEDDDDDDDEEGFEDEDEENDGPQASPTKAPEDLFFHFDADELAAYRADNPDWWKEWWDQKEYKARVRAGALVKERLADTESEWIPFAAAHSHSIYWGISASGARVGVMAVRSDEDDELGYEDADSDEDAYDDEDSGGDAPAEPPPPVAVSERLEGAGWHKYSDSLPSLFIKELEYNQLRFRYTPEALTFALVEGANFKLLLLHLTLSEGADPLPYVDQMLAHESEFGEFEWRSLAEKLGSSGARTKVWGELLGNVWHTYEGRQFVAEPPVGLEPEAGALAPFQGPAGTFPDNKDRPWLFGKRTRGEGDFYLPWDEHALATFPQLLSENRHENLKQRLAHFQKKRLLPAAHQFMRIVSEQERHAVWAPADGEECFAYSVGLYYLYNLPELLITDSLGELENTVELARFINALAAKQIAGTLRLQPGDLLSDVIAGLDEADVPPLAYAFTDRRLTRLTQEELEHFYGFGGMFYVNFMDTMFDNIPVLRVRI